jgi:hypothetical protein
LLADKRDRRRLIEQQQPTGHITAFPEFKVAFSWWVLLTTHCPVTCYLSNFSIFTPLTSTFQQPLGLRYEKGHHHEVLRLYCYMR